jgi:cyclophilin family peptidyl-prolyl cis-trans isomerase
MIQIGIKNDTQLFSRSVILPKVTWHFSSLKLLKSLVGNKHNNILNIYLNKEGTIMPTKIRLQTNMGDITIELRSDMPITTGNFKNLVQKGTFNNTIFHRVIEGFMIQGGDPTGTGYGDPSIPDIKDEFTANNRNDRGTIAMANAGPNTGSSQFFVNLVNNNFLDLKHPAFGKVIAGMDVVDKIATVKTDTNDKPRQNVTIISASVLP